MSGRMLRRIDRVAAMLDSAAEWQKWRIQQDEEERLQASTEPTAQQAPSIGTVIMKKTVSNGSEA